MPNVSNSTAPITIRKWGCNRNESPLIFVHIGKTGGGSIRARLAASALNYSRTEWSRVGSDNHFYPIYENSSQTMHRGKFASSSQLNHRLPESLAGTDARTFEGTHLCGAITPLGQAIACPWVTRKHQSCQGSRCDLVYSGHNWFGNELHWLPTPYLVNWWNPTHWRLQSSKGLKILEATEERRSARSTRCNLVNNTLEHLRDHPDCYCAKESEVDQLAKAIEDDNEDGLLVRAQMMTSLPVQRVIILREPFSWPLSKMVWHKFHMTHKCDDVEATADVWRTRIPMGYLYPLCGEYCMTAHAKGLITLEDVEHLSAYQLRNGFAVVGLLHDTDDFYNMVQKRIAYVNMTLNTDVVGLQHKSVKTGEVKRCGSVFASHDYQAKMLERIPERAVLKRLYDIGVEVNAFQKKELASCIAG